MNDYRCHKCKTLLYRAEGAIDAEIICHKCRSINYPFRADQGLGLRGQDFQMKSLDHRCDSCSRLLVKTMGEGTIEIKCKYCKNISSHEIQKGKLGTLEFNTANYTNESRKKLAY